MPRSIRIVLALALAFVVLFLLGASIERWRGKRILADTIAELRAQQALPVPEELFTPPGSSNGIHLLVSAVNRIGSVTPAPSMQVIEPGRAVACFDRLWWEGSMNRSNTWDDLIAWDRKNARELQELNQALAMPECRAHLQWEQGFKMLLPELVKYKSAANALSASARVAAHQGDKAATLTNLIAIRRLERFVAREPILISQLVRIASAALSLPGIWDMAYRADWSESDLANLQGASPSADYSTAMVESLRGESAMAIQTMKTLSAQDFGEFTALTGGGPLSLPPSIEELAPFADEFLSKSAQAFRVFVLFPIWKFAWRDQAMAFHLRAMDEMVRRSRDASRAQSLKDFNDDDLAGLRPMGWYDRMRFQLTRVALPPLQRAIAKAMRLETERALIETAIALRRFNLRHGHIPDRLEELVPDFLGALPVDRMDGQPLRYRRNPEGRYTLWSVGEDFVDDDGDATPNNQHSTILRWWNAKDAVLPQPASDTELAAWAERQTAKASKQAARSGRGSLSVDLLRRYGLVPAPDNQPPPSPGQ